MSEEAFCYFLGLLAEAFSVTIVGCTVAFSAFFFFFGGLFGVLSPISNISFISFNEAASIYDPVNLGTRIGENVYS